MKALHVGRSWPGIGNPLEATCPCPKETCGLVALDRAVPECTQHPAIRHKTMRQMHEADMCLGSPTQTPSGSVNKVCTCSWNNDYHREVRGHHVQCPTLSRSHYAGDACDNFTTGHHDRHLANASLSEQPAPYITDTYGKYTLDVYDLAVNSQDCRIVIRVGDDVKYEMKYPAYKVWTFIAHWNELAEVEDAHDDDVQDNLADANYTIRALRSVLADRERELLVLKGPCTTTGCPLHYAHSGPCNIRPTAEESRNVV